MWNHRLRLFSHCCREASDMSKQEHARGFLVLFEVVGVCAVYAVFSRQLLPLLTRAYGFGGTMLFWLSYAFFILIIVYVVRRAKGGWTPRDLGLRVDRGWRRDLCLGLSMLRTRTQIEREA